jgi:hypothetical protein
MSASRDVRLFFFKSDRCSFARVILWPRKWLLIKVDKVVLVTPIVALLVYLTIEGKKKKRKSFEEKKIESDATCKRKIDSIRLY